MSEATSAKYKSMFYYVTSDFLYVQIKGPESLQKHKKTDKMAQQLYKIQAVYPVLCDQSREPSNWLLF